MSNIMSPETPNAPMSFEDFYNENYSVALFYTAKKIPSFEDAQDLVGEVFVYCYEHFAEYDPGKSSYKTWLFLVVNSRIKNYYRDRKVHADWNDLENVLYDDENLAENAVYLEQLKATLMKLIQELPEKQQTVVVGRYFQEKSFDSLAAELGTTPGNVRVILSRAIDKLGTLYPRE